MLTPNMTLQGDRYRILRLMKQGGMGAVYEAHDTRLNHQVAIKEALVSHSTLRLAFEKEAQRLARLRHTALPKVIDHFYEGQGQYLVMEFVDGQDLGEMLAQRQVPFSTGQVLGWTYQLLDALAYLHQQNIIHRDIKPENIKLTPAGEPILLDFGLAKGGLTQTVSNKRSVIGFTPHYASPEQMIGKPTDARSDLYSLGATLYTLLTNQSPANALLREQAQIHQLPNPVRPVHILNPQVPLQLSQVITKAMALNPDWRPRDANAMKSMLQSPPNTASHLATSPISQPVAPSPSQPVSFSPPPLTPIVEVPPHLGVEQSKTSSKQKLTPKLLLLAGSALATSLVVCLLLVWVVSQSYTIENGTASLPEASPSPHVEATQPPLPPTATSVPTATSAPVTATPVATLTDDEFLTVANQWPLLFSDDFDDNSGDWRDTDGVTDPKVNISFEGRLKISIRTEENSIRETFYREAIDVPEHFLLTVDAAAVDVDACEYGLVFRGDINQQYYLFAIRGNERIFKIMRVNSPQEPQMIYSSELPSDIDLPSSLTVIGEGDFYHFYINKIFVYEMFNEELNGDRVGLETFLCPSREAEFVFDKFEVRQP